MHVIQKWIGVFSVAAVSAFAQPQEGAVGIFTQAIPAPANRVMGQTFSFISSEMSFDGAVVKNAPYSADAVTETTQQLPDGNRISQKSTSTMYRDSQGRTRREETLGAIGPWASNGEPVRSIFINDPVSKTHMVLDSNTKTVRKMPSPEAMPLPGGAVFGVAGTPGIAVSGDMVTAKIQRAPVAEKENLNVKTETLPAQTIEGVRADGTRTIMTIAAGSVGNDRPIEIVSERWYSPDLQTVVMTKHNDPRMGETTYKLTNINRSEPSPMLFEAPADYKVLEGDVMFEKLIDEEKQKMIEHKVIRQRTKE